MAVWLQWHEAMWLRESFLIWVEKRLESLMKMTDVSTLDHPEHWHNEEDEVELEPINVTQSDINITHSQDNGDTRDKLNLGYSLAKSPPHQNLTVENSRKSSVPPISYLLYHHSFVAIYRVQR